MTKDFPKIMNDIKPQIQETQDNLSKKDKYQKTK